MIIVWSECEKNHGFDPGEVLLLRWSTNPAMRLDFKTSRRHPI
jgi:hypothetical protein